MELTTCNILGLDILVTDMKKTINLIEQNIEQLRGQYICVGNVHMTVMAQALRLQRRSLQYSVRSESVREL